jgi:hypothetical protein
VKPEEPGITLSQDGHAAILLCIGPDQSFDDVATELFELLLRAQSQFPDVPRHLYVEIDGHRGDRTGFDADFFEFQQEFLLGSMGQFFTMIDTPLTGSLGNPEAQNNDVADRLQIDGTP